MVQVQIAELGIDVRIFNWSQEIHGTPCAIFRNGPPPPRFVTKISNWVRLILIYKYGGIWFDCDVMFLHSPQQIIQMFGEFVTQWENQ
jgi:hypothetical protein